MSSSSNSLSDVPQYRAVFYGGRLGTDKLARRFSCATKALAIRVEFIFEPDPLTAIDAGVSKDPTVIFDSELMLEGLVRAEDITQAVGEYLSLSA